MTKLMLGIALGLLAAHTVPGLLRTAQGWDPSGAGGQLSQFT